MSERHGQNHTGANKLLSSETSPRRFGPRLIWNRGQLSEAGVKKLLEEFKLSIFIIL